MISCDLELDISKGNRLKKMSKISGHFFWVKWYVLSYPYQLQNKNASPFWEKCVFVILSILKSV